ncbi:MAG: NTP transferase domain-containing protein [Planctomycetota bacterium]
MSLALVILAAGASARLGTCKGLVDLGGAPPVERLLRAGRAAAPAATVLVAGADVAALSAWWRSAAPSPSDEAGPHACSVRGSPHGAVGTTPEPTAGADHDQDGVRLLLNERWRAGRTGSVAVAAAALPGVDLCLAPVDVPLVGSGTFASLRAAWDAAGRPASGWLAPRFDGRFGHPIVVGRALAKRCAELAPGAPLRDLRALAAPLWAIDVADPAILDDLDTPADLERLRASLRAVPS